MMMKLNHFLKIKYMKLQYLGLLIACSYYIGILYVRSIEEALLHKFLNFMRGDK